MNNLGALPSGAPAWLRISGPLREEIFAHLHACRPEEGCGLIGGRLVDDGAQAELVIPVENALHSRVRFRMEPRAQLAGFLQIEAAGLELVAAFHSHPTGPDVPSKTDLAEFATPGALAVIAAPQPGGGWGLRAFAIQGGLADPGGPSLAVEVPLLAGAPPNGGPI